jgi:hypothetical protein
MHNTYGIVSVTLALALLINFLWELCTFELRNFQKFTTEAACQHNSSETTEQSFMKLGR